MNSEKNQPFVFLDNCAFEDLGNGLTRRILAYGDGLMQVEVHFEVGAQGTMHTHPHAQTTYVMEGEFDFTIDGVTKTVKKGDTMYYGSNVPHGCLCTKKGILLDIFSPIREDFLK